MPLRGSVRDEDHRMLFFDAARIARLLSMPQVIDALAVAFCQEAVVPPRLVAAMPGGSGDRLFLGMPAFDRDGAAVKLTTILPDNAARGLPTIQAAIMLFSATGTPVALLDGTFITRLRTSAASALASRYLSRQDSERLLVIGTGALAPYMAAAHCAVRPIGHVHIWGRNREKTEAAAAAAKAMLGPQSVVCVADSLEKAVASADIVSCATNSAVPVFDGSWLKSGAFVDLVGSFSPTRRESDDHVIGRARLFVDTLEGALAEAGDILDPLRRGIITRAHIEGELAGLIRGDVAGRRDAHEITLFKSVGTAIEDLAIARLVMTAAQEDEAEGSLPLFGLAEPDCAR